MDKTKRFRKSIIGFKKNDVYEYIEELYKNFEYQLNEKDNEIIALNKQNIIYKDKIEKLSDNFEGIEDYKSNIADVLLNAKSQGQKIIKDATEEAEKIKNELELFMKTEKEKVNSFRDDLVNYKNNGSDLLKKIEKEVEELIETSLNNY